MSEGFWHNLFHVNDIDNNEMSQKIVYIVVSSL